MSTKAWVTHQATRFVVPEMREARHAGNGEADHVEFVARLMCICAYMLGISSTRCGSPATSGRPVAVRCGASAQLLLPPPVDTVRRDFELARRRRARRSSSAARYGPFSRPGRQTKQLVAAVVEAKLGDTFHADDRGSAAACQSFHQTEPIRKPI